MSSPALAILWEIWRKNRWGLMTILAAVPVWAVLSRALVGPLQPTGDDTLKMLWPVMVFFTAAVPMWISLLALGVMFCYTESEPHRGHARFPSRLFTLPVRTSSLVTYPMLYGIVAVVLVALGWEKFVLSSLPRTEWMPQHFIPLLPVATAMVLLPATVWSLPGFPGNRLIVLSLLLFGLIWLVAWPKAHGSVGDWPVERVTSFERNSNLALVGVSALAYLIALFAVERDRRGGGTGWAPLWKRVCKFAEVLPRRNRPFQSSAGAQFWFEWHRNGALLPFTVGCFMALILGPVSLIVKLESLSFAAPIDPGSTAAIFCVIVALPLVLAFVIGKRHAEMELTTTSFQLLRPITRGELILTKLRVAAASAALSWLLVLVIAPLWFVLWCDTSMLAGSWRAMQAYHSQLALFVMLALGLIAVVALTWRWLVVSLYLGLWGRPRVFISSAAISLLGGWIMLLVVVNHFDHSKQLKQWLEAVRYLAIFAALKGVVAAWSLQKAHRLGLLTARAIVTYLGIWLVATLCLAAVGWLLLASTIVPKLAIVLGAMLVFPLARIGLAPLALDSNRCR